MKHSTLSSSPNSGNTIVSRSQFKPILFSTDMVEAITSGNKIQTRRIIKEAKGWDINWKVVPIKEEHLDGLQRYEIRCGTQYHLPWFKAKCNVGDILWVRETWRKTTWLHPGDEFYGYVYKASENGREWESCDESWIWKPSIFMPKEACRLFLEVTDVRAERLQDIKYEDAIAEGAKPCLNELSMDDRCHNYNNPSTARFPLVHVVGYKNIWGKINGQKSWEENPYVWVITFKIVECPQGFC